MKTVMLVETAVRWYTIEVEDDFDENTVDENHIIREQMFSSIALNGWDGDDVLESRWDVNP